MKKSLITLCLVLFTLSGCSHSKIISIQKLSIQIPEADLVFNTIETPKKDMLFGDEILGFYTFETNSTEYLYTGSNLITPIFVDADTIVAIDKQGNPGSVNSFSGKVFILSNQQYRYCRSDEAFGGNLQTYLGNVLLSTIYSINLIDINTCELIKTIITAEDLQSIDAPPKISTFDLSNNGEVLILSLFSRKLIRIELPEKEVLTYGTLGMYPALSPDDKQFAYLGYDGIHVVDVDGKNDKLLIDCGVRKPMNEDCFERGNESKPQWSKDGKRLVYHKCNSSSLNCSDIGDYDIYTYDIETKQEELIIHGGLNPSWNYFKN